MNVIVLQTGLHSMIVDSGRIGHRSSGIGPCGPMDSFAYQIGNFLVGNEHPGCAIEFFQNGPELLFHEPALVSITGPGASGALNGSHIMSWRPHLIPKDSVLRLTVSGEGSIGYLSIYGGWTAHQWLGSGTTMISAGIGGVSGKLLQRNDQINFNILPWNLASRNLNWSISEIELAEVYSGEKHISCVKGPEASLQASELLDQFTSQSFQISSRSNRMGYRLAGNALKSVPMVELVSSPVDFGTIQLLPDGQLIVLMADHQTTGGYPRLANVIYTDLPRLAQYSKNRLLYFSWCPVDLAYTLYEARLKKIKDLKNSCLLKLKPYLH